MHNTYFRLGDELRYEYCSEAALLEAARALREEINQEITHVLMYDLPTHIRNDHEKITAVFNAFE